MNKELQREDNRIVLNAIQQMNQELHKCSSSKRLRKCTAEVITTDNLYVLISYKTAVACIDKETDTLYDFLLYTYHYTNTSAGHIAKFNHDYSKNRVHCTTEYRYYPVD